MRIRLKYAFTDRDEKNQPVEMDVLIKEKENTERETYSDNDVNLEMFDKGNRKYIEMVEGYRKSGYLKKLD